MASSSSQEYIDLTLVPTGSKGDRSFWVHHILPLPISPDLAQKWDYILERSRIWYEDSDGDDITIGSSSELVAAVRELESERRFVRFRFKMANFMDDALLFRMMDDLDRVKIRYRVFGSDSIRGSIELDKETRVVKEKVPYKNWEERQAFEEEAKMPEEEVDPSIFDQLTPNSVVLGANVEIGKNVIIDDNPNAPKNVDQDYEYLYTVPQHDDLAHTPEEWSPVPSPRLEPFANNDTPLIELPCVPTHVPVPARTSDDDEEEEETADDPPDSAPSESAFPDPPFPGSFPVDPTNPTQFRDQQSRISSTIQSTLDALIRLGHLTINAAQNTGFPVANANTFDNARRTLDINTESARTNLQQGLESARINLQATLESARATVQANLTSTRTNIDTARNEINAGLTTGLSSASIALTAATRQVEQAIRSAAITIQQSGAVSPTLADRIIRDLRTAGERVEHAVDDMTLRIQRRIDQHALEHHNGSVVEEEEDIYGAPAPSNLPGSFPVERTKVEECTNQLVEMGFFTEGQRDSAGAVSVAADGDIVSALEIIGSKD
jgi:hypothetical protein